MNIGRQPDLSTSLVALALIPLGALPLLLRFDNYYLQVMSMALLFAYLALSWSLLRYCGQISFGHAAFFGVGAYTSALLSLKAGLSPWLGLLLGGGMAMVASAVVGFASLTLRGPYFSLATLAWAEVLKAIVLNMGAVTNGPQGLVGIPPFPTLGFHGLTFDFYGTPGPNYYLVLACLTMLILVTSWIARSKLGLAFLAVREGEEAAEALGVNTFKYKMAALLISAFFTGLGGAIYAHLVHFIAPGMAFNIYFSAIPMVMALFGGALTIMGPVIGALSLYLANEFIFKGLFLTAHELLYGAMIMAVMLFMPRGIVGWLEERWRAYAPS